MSFVRHSEGVRKATHAGVHLQVVTQARKMEESAVTMLLDMVCDVVLLLDANLQIVDHAPRFSAMLMMGSAQSVNGKQTWF